jgi:uncharacterized protein YecE (DUF72 family)
MALKTCVRIGIAGWSVPPRLRNAEMVGQSLLEQYADLFNAVEINSSFHRPHRLETYERWRRSVPESFRFAAKVPKLITHERRLGECRDAITEFLSAVSGLGDQLGALLLQLPPSLVFDKIVARDFFGALRERVSSPIACEARHASWFGSAVAELFQDFQITRVLADPAAAGCECSAGEAGQFGYQRLHGSPRMYYSAYSSEYLQELATQIAASQLNRPGAERWYIFDNTAAGAAWSDAQLLQRRLALASG